MQGNVVPRTGSTGEASRSLPDIVTRPGSKSSNQRDRLIATLRYYHDKNRMLVKLSSKRQEEHI